MVRSAARSSSLLARLLPVLLLFVSLPFTILFAFPAPASAEAPAAPCPSCGAAVAADAIFCPACGSALPAPDRIHCWRCAAPAGVTDRFCSRCGSRLGGQGAGQPAGQNAGQNAGAPDPARAESLREAAPPRQNATPGDRDSASETVGGAGAAPAGSVTATTEDAAAVPVGTATIPGRESKLAVWLRTGEIVPPPRVITIPTGTILPAMTLHASGAGSFGFQDGGASSGGLLSFGLGGVGELQLSTTRIFHFSDRENRAIAAVRVGLPLKRLDAGLGRVLAMALNLGVTDDDSYSLTRSATSADGYPVSGLGYEYRETTAGIAATVSYHAVRGHAALHTTDLRISNLYYSAMGTQTEDQRVVFASWGVALDAQVNPRTFVLGELRTTPRTDFRYSDKEILVDHVTEYAAGLRFYPSARIGLDTIVSADENVVGLADLELGVGFHLTLSPKRATGH